MLLGAPNWWEMLFDAGVSKKRPWSPSVLKYENGKSAHCLWSFLSKKTRNEDWTCLVYGMRRESKADAKTQIAFSPFFAVFLEHVALLWHENKWLMSIAGGSFREAISVQIWGLQIHNERNHTNRCGCPAGTSCKKCAGHSRRDLSKTFSIFLRCVSMKSWKMPNHTAHDVVKQLQCFTKNTQPQKRHGHKMMHPSFSQLQHALRANKDMQVLLDLGDKDKWQIQTWDL